MMTFEDWCKQRNAELGVVAGDDYLKAEWAVWEAIDMYSLVKGNTHIEPWYVEEQREALTKAIDEFRSYVWSDGYRGELKGDGRK